MWFQMEFVLNQFHRDSQHVSMVSCKDVPFLEKLDECEFLFGMQCVAYVSNLRRFLHRQWYLLAECVLQLDKNFGDLGDQGPFLLELCRCCQSISHLIALLVVVICSLDVSPDGLESTRTWHL
jgi:hypothetical protein